MCLSPPGLLEYRQEPMNSSCDTGIRRSKPAPCRLRRRLNLPLGLLALRRLLLHIAVVDVVLLAQLFSSSFQRRPPFDPSRPLATLTTRYPPSPRSITSLEKHTGQPTPPDFKLGASAMKARMHSSWKTSLFSHRMARGVQVTWPQRA